MTNVVQCSLMQNNESGSKVKKKKEKKKKRKRKPYHLQAQTCTCIQEQNKWTKQRKENKVEGMSFPKWNPLPGIRIRIAKGYDRKLKFGQTQER